MKSGPFRSKLVLFLVCAALMPLFAVVEGDMLVRSAREQVGKTLYYDPSYVKIDYPGGDVPIQTGVCTDVVIRAFRGQGMDLQRLVHEDMSRAFGKYPKMWGLKAPDSNIDHRRVPNLATFFRRKGWDIPIGTKAENYQSGDIVVWTLPGGRPHIGIVSDRKAPDGVTPLVIHNIGGGTQEENVLFEYRITGAFRPGNSSRTP